MADKRSSTSVAELQLSGSSISLSSEPGWRGMSSLTKIQRPTSVTTRLSAKHHPLPKRSSSQNEMTEISRKSVPRERKTASTSSKSPAVASDSHCSKVSLTRTPSSSQRKSKKGRKKNIIPQEKANQVQLAVCNKINPNEYGGNELTCSPNPDTAASFALLTNCNECSPEENDSFWTSWNQLNARLDNVSDSLSVSITANKRQHNQNLPHEPSDAFIYDRSFVDTSDDCGSNLTESGYDSQPTQLIYSIASIDSVPQASQISVSDEHLRTSVNDVTCKTIFRSSLCVNNKVAESKAASTIQRWYRRQVVQNNFKLKQMLDNMKWEKQIEMVKPTEKMKTGRIEYKERKVPQKRRMHRYNQRKSATNEDTLVEMVQGNTPVKADSDVAEPQESTESKTASGKDNIPPDKAELNFANVGQLIIEDDLSLAHKTSDGNECDTKVIEQEENSQHTAITVIEKEQISHNSQVGSEKRESQFDNIMETLKKFETGHDLEGIKSAGGHYSIYDSDDVKPSLSSTEAHSELAHDKLNSIMSFLDEVEENDKTTLNELNQPFQCRQAKDNLEEVSLAASQVATTVLSQKAKLEEKEYSIQGLQMALEQQRQLSLRNAREADKELKQRLQTQKEEYGVAIKRHLTFIDQLIDDKKSLTEKCEKLLKELKSVEKKYSEKYEHMEETHTRELQKVKEMHAAAEKLRREKWIEEKTRRIKEMTVKGLEPEIQRLIAKHKAEVKSLKSTHEQALLGAEEQMRERFNQQVEEIREQCAREKEAACAHERELARQKYEKQIELEEASYQQQRAHLYAELQTEKDFLAEQTTQQQAEIQKLQRDIESSGKIVIETLREEFSREKQEINDKHRTEIREMQERLQVEKDAWEENHKKKQEIWLSTKERELREQLRAERDKSIETVIERLERDSATNREECEQAAENRIKRIRVKYEAELKEVEANERDTAEKYAQMKGRLMDVEGDNARLMAQLNQKEKDIEEMQKVLSQLTSERDHVRDVLRQEFADRIVSTEEENKHLKNNVVELNAAHKCELERVRLDARKLVLAKEAEMDELHKRIKVALVKKEETISQIKEQYQAAVKRADHLEELLDLQRKQLLAIPK